MAPYMVMAQQPASEYNRLLKDIVQRTNDKFGLDSKRHIFDPGFEEDASFLRGEYGFIAVDIDFGSGVLRNPPIYTRGNGTDWIRDTLNNRAIDYKMSILDHPVDNDPGISSIVGARSVQVGMCVFSDNTDTSVFEVHDVGNELLVFPELSNISVIARGIRPGSIDLDTAVMVYMPTTRDNSRGYVLGPHSAHYAPHLTGFSLVALPEGTNQDLTVSEKKMYKDTPLTANNKYLFTTHDHMQEMHTTGILQGETVVTDAIKEIQEEVSKQVPIEDLLGN